MKRRRKKLRKKKRGGRKKMRKMTPPPQKKKINFSRSATGTVEPAPSSAMDGDDDMVGTGP